MPNKFPNPNVMSPPIPVQLPSNNVSNGRNLIGDYVFYDIDIKLAGEVMPEVTPITKYVSDPELVMGRQIAVNNSYICYGLKQGPVRVLNVNTALRSLLKGLTQRVTDMAFFAEDVPLLASASIDGRVYVWKITEIPVEEPHITGKIVIAVQIVDEGESLHPRVCWHCHKQEVLVVGIGRRILKIDTTKVGRGEVYSADEPLKCHVDKLINGIQFVGNHDGEVTDLSMCQWMITRLVSASVDGTIKIWEDRKSTPIAVLRPHDGQPVNSVTFLTAPHRPDHIILITGGPVNREVKIWVSESEEGWLLPSDADSWHCTQTLELKSSTESRLNDAFFNQVVALSQPGLLLLANAKKNAIYAVHLEYGLNPETTHMDNIYEFTVTMPILSLTGASQLIPHGEIIKLYCVQTQAIQQYSLDLSRCLPPPIDGVVYDKSDLSDAMITEGFTGLDPICSMTNDTDNSSVVSPTAPLSPRLSRKLSNCRTPSGGFESSTLPDGHGDQKVIECAVDRQIATALSNLSNLSNFSNVSSVDDDSKNGDNKAAKDDNTIKFKHPTHLVTPAELMATSPSDLQDVVENSASQNVDMDVVKILGETGFCQSQRENVDSIANVEHKVKSFSSQVSDLGHGKARETYYVNDLKQIDGTEEMVQILDVRDEVQDVGNDLMTVKCPALKGKKQKGKKAQGSGPSSPSISVFNSLDSSTNAVFSQIRFMQETIAQVLINQKEIQKQIPVLLTVPITKEGRRIETAIGKTMEKAYKASSNVQWDRTQEEFIKQEMANQNRHQQISGLVTNGFKDLLATWEKMLKKEMAALLPAVVRSVTPIIEKTVSSAILEAFQRGIGDKALNQVEKSVHSKLEATVARQIQSQFQTSGKQALQEALRSSMEASVVPAFEMSCKAMCDQLDAIFHKGIIELKIAAQKQVECTHSSLAIALRDAINSASSMTQTLTSELADGQRKLVVLAVTGTTSKAGNPMINQISNGSINGLRDKIEARVDPTKELSRLLNEHRYQEAFITALQRSDVSIVSWLCSQVDIQRILTSKPLPLSQGVLLSLLQQLACDIVNNTSQKLSWMMNLVMEIKPTDSVIAIHVRPIFDQVYSVLNHQVSLPATSVSEISSIRIIMRLIDPILRSL